MKVKQALQEADKAILRVCLNNDENLVFPISKKAMRDELRFLENVLDMEMTYSEDYPSLAFHYTFENKELSICYDEGKFSLYINNKIIYLNGITKGEADET